LFYLPVKERIFPVTKPVIIAIPIVIAIPVNWAELIGYYQNLPQK
jgi:hypothetical protein